MSVLLSKMFYLHPDLDFLFLFLYLPFNFINYKFGLKINIFNYKMTQICLLLFNWVLELVIGYHFISNYLNLFDYFI